MRGGLLTSRRHVRLPHSMRRFSGRQDKGGFTIIETMIVLAVTGALFLSAAIMISGRQNQTAFDQSIRQIQSQIQQAINEVSIGYFPDTDFSCTAGGSGPVLTSVASGGQGTKSGCIFLGKAIQFHVGGTDPEAFRVYTLAALQKTAAGAEVSTYVEAQPKVVSPTTSSPTTPDISYGGTLQNGLATNEMYYLNNAGTVKTNVSVISFVKSLAQYDGSSLVSGSQQVNVVPIRNTWLNGQPIGIGEVINSNFNISPINPLNGVSICFVSGTTNQSALITIGGLNRELAVKLDIKDNKTCA